MGKVALKGGMALLLLATVTVLAGCGAPMAEPGWSAVTGDASTAYAALAGKLHALNVDSGQQRWEFPAGKDQLAGLYGEPALAKGMIIFGGGQPSGGSSTVYAVDAASGEQRWAFKDAKDTIVAAPTVDGDTVYVTSADHNVYALNLENGQVRWTFSTGGWVWGGVVRSGDLLYVGSMDHAVYALRASDGQQVWRFEAPAAVPGTPAVGDGLVFVGDLTGTVYALDAQTGKRVWREKVGGWVWGQPALDGNSTLYVSSLDHNVYALDAKTGGRRVMATTPEWGTQYWSIATQGVVRAGPVVVDGIVYIASEDHSLYAVELAKVGGEPEHTVRLWTYDAGGPLLTSPIVVDGTIYGVTSNGKAFALDAKTGGQRWVYPQPSK